MKTALLALILGFTAFWATPETDLKMYKTYQDYLNDSGEEYTFKRLYWPSAVGIGLMAYKDDKKVQLDGNDYWGYKFKDALFRFDHRYNQPVRVLSVGKIVYYENGQSHMNMVEHNIPSSSFRYGFYCYISKDLTTDVIPLSTYSAFGTKGKIADFRKEYPEYNEFFECLGRKYEYEKARKCLDDFEGR